MHPPPSIRLWREDIAVRMLPVETFRALAEPVADDNCSGQPVEPLERALPDFLRERPAYIASVIDGRIAAPRCQLLTRERELVLDTLETARTRNFAFDQYTGVVESFNQRSNKGEPVALVGSQRMHAYWHWWIDVIPRIWLLERYGGSEAMGLPLAMPPLRPFQQEAIELLGYGDRVLTLKRGVHRFAKVVFTPGVTGKHPAYPSALLGEFSPWLRARIRAALANSGHQAATRIFIGRRDAPRPKRKIVNEDEVRDHLAGRGFMCIDGSKLSVTEQAALFSNAEVVIGPHGAGLTNLLFCGPGTHVIEIFPASGARPLSCYRLVASHLGLLYTRMVVPSSATRFGQSPKQQALNDNMVVDIDALDRRLELMSLGSP